MVVCITGNIASGKDLASNYIKKYFDLYLDVDKIAKQIFYNKTKIIKDIFKTDDRSIIGEIAFKDKNKMYELERIIHPVLRNMIINIVNSIQITRNKYIKNILINCAIIFKLRLEFFCDYIIGIDSNEDIRLKRLIKYRGFDKNKAINAIKIQRDIKDFSKNLDFIVDNNNDKNYMFYQLDEIIQRCIKKDI